MLLSYHGHSDVVVALSWTSHGDRIASTGFDKTVQVWQAE
jgi:WD40 repeat protein